MTISSSPRMLGIVTRPAALSSSTSLVRRISCSFSGSTARAKRQLESVYSCAQYTLVSSGRPASLSSDSCISPGLPSNRRPQPTLNRVSPQNRQPCPKNAIWLLVWPGISSTLNSSSSAGRADGLVLSQTCGFGPAMRGIVRPEDFSSGQFSAGVSCPQCDRGDGA